MNVVPYEAEHLLRIQLQAAQRGQEAFITPEYAKSLEGPLAFTALVDGQPVAVGGIQELWQHRALVWSFIDPAAGPHFREVHRIALQALDLAPYRRIEADTPCGFAPGHRWLRMLGFQLEAPCMHAYGVDGGDYALYAKVR